MLKSIICFVLLVVSLSYAGISQHNPFYCFSQDQIRPQVGMFSWLTYYNINRGRHINSTVSSCSPSKFWMLTRHGIQLPNMADINNMLCYGENLRRDILKNYDAGRTNLCASDLELIRSWSFDTNMTGYPSYLATSGWNELKGLSQRYQAAFPAILPQIYSKSHYFFKSSDTQRTNASIRAFTDGLFGDNGFEQVDFEEPDYPDYLLRPHQFCSLRDDLYYLATEHDAFADGPEYHEMLTQVSTKLGFHGSNILRPIEVETLYKMCVYDQTLYPDKLSSMCTAFSIANHEVLEYHSDLQLYYRHGYGRTEFRGLLENNICHIMQDLLQFLQSYDPNDHKARVFNTHINVIYPFLVTLGVFYDENLLTRHNFAQQAFRLWRSSIIMPMSTNIAVIRYDCADGDNDILFMLNEKPLQIPSCQANGLCKQSFIMERFGRYLEANCTDIFCTMG